MDIILAQLVAVAVLLILLALYFLPAIVGSRRDHHNQTAIAVLNLLFGWTLLGWGLAMVWACTAVQPSAGR